MSRSPSRNYNKGKNIKEEDLLDIVENLEKRRRRFLIMMTHNFVLWGRILSETEALIQEFKRRKWKE